MRIVVFFVALFMISSCGSESPKDKASKSAAPEPKVSTNDGKGIGEIKSVTLNDPLDQDMIKRGKGIYDMKCAACHRTTAMRVVGPGFKGVTDRRKPEWIMNMITNVETMLEKDPDAQALLEECLTRMPNQNVTVGDARDVLEFFYSIETAE